MTALEVDVFVDVDALYAGRVSSNAVRAAVRAALSAARHANDNQGNWSGPCEVSVHITGDQEIRQLNREFRDADRPTDVLSFALQEGEQLPLPPGMALPLGEVVVSYPYARRQAEELAHSVGMEIAWLVIHGSLQLLGYAHATEDEAREMEGLEDVALRSLGFSKR